MGDYDGEKKYNHVDDCILCGRPSLRSQNLNEVNNHEVYVDEFDRRRAAGLCASCGKNETAKEWCDECGKTGVEYVGYDKLTLT